MKRLPRTSLIDTAAVLAMLAAGVAGLSSIFSGSAWLVAVLGAVVVGALIGVAGRALGWPFAVHAAAVTVAYFLTGGALVLRSTTIAGVVPSWDTILGLARGAVDSWMDLLTVQVPTEGVEVVILAPFIAVLVMTTAAVGLALRPRWSGLAVIPAAALMVFAIAFGSYHDVAPLAQALGFVAVAVAWGSFRRSLSRHGGEGSKAPAAPARRAVAAGGLLAVGLLGGVGLSTVVAPAGTRDILRDEVVPPLELHDYPSPLQSFRSIVRDDKDQVLFTVTGLPAGATVRLATMGSYNGVVYAVSGDGTAVSGSFERVGTAIPTTAEGASARVTVDIGALDGVWLPTVGEVHEVSFTGPRADTESRALHYNRTTRTAVVTAGLAEGDAYALDVVIPQVPTDEQLATAEFAAVPLPRVELVPDGLRTLAADATADATSPYAQVQALASFLEGSGYFSHGLENQAPSRSGHGAERIAGLIGEDTMVGDDEQYAVAFALMAHELGIPARVVMGFTSDAASGGPWEVTGEDVHVWAEVAYEDLGWVAVDAVPAEDRTPINEEVPPEREPKPQVLQPPPPPQEPADVPPAVPADDEALEDPDDTLQQVWQVLVYAGAGLGVLLVLAGPAVAVLIAKARRRRRRRKARDVSDRVAGGWLEVVDTAADYGVALPVGLTRVEKGRIVDAALGAVSTIELAQGADRHVWGPGVVPDEVADGYWNDVRATVRALHRSRSLRARTAAKLSVRSLTKPSRRRGSGAS